MSSIIFHILFSKNIVENIRELSFEIDNHKKVENYENYVCRIIKNDIEYIFYAVYYENYLMIYFDSYYKKIDSNNEHNDIYLIPMLWNCIKKNGNEYFIPDIYNNNQFNGERDIIHFRGRKKLFHNQLSFSLEDYMKITSIEKFYCIIYDNSYNINNYLKKKYFKMKF